MSSSRPSTRSSNKRSLSPEPFQPTPTKKSRVVARKSALSTPSPQSSSSSSSPPPASTVKKQVTFSTSLLPPTPSSPSSRHSSHSSCLSSSSLPSPTPSPQRTPALPSHLHSLLLLHRSISLTLSLHLAQHPPVLPPRSAEKRKKDPIGLEEESILLKGVANFEGINGIRETVELGAERKFVLEDLRRLAWIWEWDDERLPTAPLPRLSQTPTKKKPNPFLVASPRLSPEETARSSLCSLSITPARTLSRQTRSITHTYAFNLLIDHSPYTGGVVGAIGRWSAKQSEREDEFKVRLERYAEIVAREEGRKVPMSPFEALPKAGVAQRGGLVALGSASASQAGSSASSPRKLLFPPSSTPSTPSASDPSSAPSTPSTTSRRQALRDRIAAKSQSTTTTHSASAALFASAGISSLSGTRTSGGVGFGGKGADMEGLKRRSVLSRLGSVAEAVFMLFTSPSTTGSSGALAAAGSSLGNGQRRKAIQIEEVAHVLVKSSKVEISFAEALQSLHLLLQLCPFFLVSRQLNNEQYIEMPSSPACPSSPSSSSPPPGSAFGGKGGLREVRELIRRELEE